MAPIGPRRPRIGHSQVSVGIDCREASPEDLMLRDDQFILWVIVSEQQAINLINFPVEYVPNAVDSSSSSLTTLYLKW